MNVLKDYEINELRIPSGCFYGPCSGQDLSIAFYLFGDNIDHFVFCDLDYVGRNVSVKEAVPDIWVLISHEFALHRQQSEKKTWYSGNEPFRPFSNIERWRRPDGSDVVVELRRDLAEDALLDQFGPESISAFMHINDGSGEGGSDLWFLATPDHAEDNNGRCQCLLPEVTQRLAKGAIIVTDGALADSGFRSHAPFEAGGVRWEPLGMLANNRLEDRQPTMWTIKV